MAPLIMKLCGEAIIPKTAERAIVDLEVSSSSESRETASDEVTNTAKELQKLLRQHAPADSSEAAKASAAIAKWAMGKMVTDSYMKIISSYNQQKQMYRAKVNFNIRVRDFTRLGALTQTFSQMKHVQIQRTYWILTAQTRKAYRSELRKMAAADAMQRAEDYATTLGLQHVTPLELTEQAYTDGSGFVQPVHFSRSGMGGGGLFGGAAQMQQQQQMQQQHQIQQQQQSQSAGDDGGIDLFFEPDEIQLMLRVECKFAAE